MTRQCNLDCSYCYVFKQKKLDYQDLNLIKRGILFFLYQPWYIKEVTLLGWEICLVPLDWIHEIFLLLVKMRKILNKAISIVVVTNGTLYKKEYFELFQEFCDEIRISIDWHPDNHDLDRGIWSGAKILTVFNTLIWEIPSITQKISINKVISPNNVATLESDIFFLYENYLSKLQGKWLSIGTAQGVSGWTKKHKLQLWVNGTKIMRTLQESPEMSQKMKRIFNIKFWCCLYENMAMGFDWKIYNCDFNANRVDLMWANTYIYDIEKDLINPQLDINSCHFDMLSEDCKNETCSTCTGTCMNFDTKKSTILEGDDADILKSIKIEWRLWTMLQYRNTEYTIKFEWISPISNVKIYNFLLPFCSSLNTKNVNIIIDGIIDFDKWKLIKQLEKFSLNFISWNKFDRLNLIVNIETEFIMNNNREIIGDIIVWVSPIDFFN